MTTMGLRSVRAGARLDYLLADDMVGLQENRTADQRELVRQTYYSVVDPMVVPLSIGRRCSATPCKEPRCLASG